MGKRSVGEHMNESGRAAGVDSLDACLAERLQALGKEGLYRVIREIDSPQGGHIEVDGRSMLNFSSNDYLGLANDPSLKAAAIKAIKEFGIGSGSSRLISGSLAPHVQLEAALAEFKGTEACLTFSTGYAAAMGTICALLGKDDVIVLDKLCHACLVDAARLCGATLRVFAHNDLDALERLLKWAASLNRPAGSTARTLIVTESLFSMDADAAPLRKIVDLKEQYGAWLMVDEAHATGLYGANRRGIAEEMGVGNRIEVQMGTLSKALGASGGYICGTQTLIDFLVNRARNFIFSTAPVPAASAAALEAIKFVRSEKGALRCSSLWERVAEFNAQYISQSLPVKTRSAIIPIMVGAADASIQNAKELRNAGFFVPAIRYPTVARGKARLRISISAAHSPADIAKLTAALRQICPPSSALPSIPHASASA